MKKLLIAIFAFSLIVCTPFLASAKEAKITLPSFDVTLNGTVIENTNREYPLIVYNDITYFPMTYYDCRYLGLTTNWDNDTRTLSVDKKNITCTYRDYKSQNTNKDTYTASVCDFDIKVNGEEIYNSAEKYPLLTFRDVTYFPLTWRFAVVKFEWEYNFDPQSGLRINSKSDFKISELDLPKRTGAVAFDGEFYYYNVNDGEDNYVYTAFEETPADAYIVHHLPRGGLSRNGASFINSYDGVYIKYTVGSSPVMSSQRFLKLDGQGRVAQYKYPDKGGFNKHGSDYIFVGNEEISVEAHDEYFDGRTIITYTKNGETMEAPALPGRVQMGACRNGKNIGGAYYGDYIKIFGNKIYFVGIDLEEPYETRSSNLYVIDTDTNKAKLLIEGVCGFHVYNGWSNENKADSTMILFDDDGITMRYTELDGEIRRVDETDDTKDLVLTKAVGEYTIYAIYQAADGSKTVVKSFGGYAQGGTIFDRVLFESTTGTVSEVSGDKLAIYTLGEAVGDDIRFMVYGDGAEFLSSDAVENVFLRDNVLIYTVNGKVYRVDFE